MKRRIIEDNKVIHIWRGTRDDDFATQYEIEISPDWYENNGTPMDEIGDDMKYIRTEIIEK